ncbi:unnamed protein product [Cercospora beticola]|nr:unnamed protein product [Cercospora beticola]
MSTQGALFDKPTARAGSRTEAACAYLSLGTYAPLLSDAAPWSFATPASAQTPRPHSGGTRIIEHNPACSERTLFHCTTYTAQTALQAFRPPSIAVTVAAAARDQSRPKLHLPPRRIPRL